jgi:hypothetical protein
VIRRGHLSKEVEGGHFPTSLLYEVRKRFSFPVIVRKLSRCFWSHSEELFSSGSLSPGRSKVLFLFTSLISLHHRRILKLETQVLDGKKESDPFSSKILDKYQFFN